MVWGLAVFPTPYHERTDSVSTLRDQYSRPTTDWPKPNLDEGVEFVELDSLPPLPQVAWHTKERENLGKQLFFDPRMSASGQIACASCHDSHLGWTDGRRAAFGHDRTLGSRNSMTLLNAAYFNALFWDGRADGIVNLMLQPIQNPIEMNATIDGVVNRLSSIESYRTEFENAFGSREITPDRIALSLASFVRTIRSSRSHFDRFVEGEHRLLTDQEIEGLHLFRTKARCMNCHHGPLLSDGKFHHTGLSYFGRRFEDLGRYEITGEMADRGKFRTPMLRDLKFTGPYMHNGLFANFTGVLRMYNHGITFNSKRIPPEAPALSPLIQPLNLTKSEIVALEAFLHKLSRVSYFVPVPELPQSSQDQAREASTVRHSQRIETVYIESKTKE